MFIGKKEWLRGLATNIVCSFGAPQPENQAEVARRLLWLNNPGEFHNRRISAT